MARASGRLRAAFTLIELLVVMALMAFITTIVMSGAFGMSRASYYTAAQDLVYNMMQMAHQHACIDGQDVYVVFKDEKVVTVIQGIGRMGSNLKDGFFIDNSSKLGITSETGDNKIYNLSSGGVASLKEIVESSEQDNHYRVPLVIPNYKADGTCSKRGVVGVEDLQDDRSRSFFCYARKVFVEDVSGSWKLGDLYGFEIIQEQSLPKGYRFGFNSPGATPENDAVCFYADGSTGIGKFGKAISKNDSKVTIYVTETISKDVDKTIQVLVDKGTVQVKSARNSNDEQ